MEVAYNTTKGLNAQGFNRSSQEQSFIKWNTQSGTKKVEKTEDDELDAVFQEIKEAVSLTSIKDSSINAAFLWFEQVLEYNVRCGTKSMGISVVTSFKHLARSSTLEDLKLARILGLCVEMLQAFFTMYHDYITQASFDHQGRPCWYKKEHIGVLSVNDSCFTKSLVFFLLKKYLQHKACYRDIMELFLETTHNRVIGQRLDLISTVGEKIDFGKFTMDQYIAMTGRKTSFFSLYLPTAVAMHLAGISGTDVHLKAQNILLQMGLLYQIQEDFMSCFGCPSQPGGLGRCIREKKCTWLVVKALELGCVNQKAELEECYGRDDDQSVERVLTIYKDLRLPDHYQEIKDKSIQEILRLIHSSGQSLPKELFGDVANLMFQESNLFRDL